MTVGKSLLAKKTGWLGMSRNLVDKLGTLYILGTHRFIFGKLGICKKSKNIIQKSNEFTRTHILVVAVVATFQIQNSQRFYFTSVS